jgi:uncharacterized protein YndB with AHSA1/START domain
MTHNLSMTFTVADRSREEVFAAILDVSAWWGRIDGSTDQLGSEWTYRVQDMHYTKMRTTELVPAERVAWLVDESFLGFVQDKEEWTGTSLVFELADVGGGTEVRFTHAGLNPGHECYDVCSNAWDQYIYGSLRDLLVSGAGRPNSLEGNTAIEAAR